jgi:hypothetical protein
MHAPAGGEVDEFLAVFTKLPTSVAGPGATVSLHSHITSSVDYEAERAIVIGTTRRETVLIPLKICGSQHSDRRTQPSRQPTSAAKLW